jgi:hypothetical protein
MKDVKEGIELQRFDSCHRCGLRKRTRELAEQGVLMRLCDDCYWGKEPPVAGKDEPKAQGH